jgi:hypothetical protein
VLQCVFDFATRNIYFTKLNFCFFCTQVKFWLEVFYFWTHIKWNENWNKKLQIIASISNKFCITIIPPSFSFLLFSRKMWSTIRTTSIIKVGALVKMTLIKINGIPSKCNAKYFNSQTLFVTVIWYRRIVMTMSLFAFSFVFVFGLLST